MENHLKYLIAMTAAVLISACTDSNKIVKISVNTSSSLAAPTGTVVIAGKEWMHCSLGQTWENNTCTGDAKKFTFDEAQAATLAVNDSGYAAKRDWKIPAFMELQSLRVCTTGFYDEKLNIQDVSERISTFCNDNSAKPTIDIESFPKTFNDRYWSSSPHFDNKDHVWSVNFRDGGVLGVKRSDSYYVRLVR